MSGAGSLTVLFKVDNTGAIASMNTAEISMTRALESIRNQVKLSAARIKELESGTRSLGGASHMATATQSVLKYGQAAELSAKQQARAFQMLPAQISDVTVSLMSGQQPWLVLIQQGSQVKDMFGGLGGAARALMTFITPMNVAIAAAAGVVAAVGYAMVESITNTKEFAKGIVLTGNAAGMTEDSLRAMSERVHMTARITVGSARDILQALANTGRFGPESIEKVAVGVQRLASITGESAEKIVEKFVSVNDGVVKWALEQNKQLNFMTPAIYAAAKAAEEMGNKSEALNLVLDAMNARLETGASAWDRIKAGMRAARDFALTPARALAGAFADLTPEEHLLAVQSRIRTLKEFEARRPADSPFKNPELIALLEAERILKRARDAQDSGARDAAKTVAANREAIEARRVLDAVLDTERSHRRVNEEVAKTVAMFKQLEASGIGYKPEEQERILAAVRKKYAPPKQTEWPGAIRSGTEQSRNDFGRSEIAAYAKIEKAERDASDRAAKDSWEIQKRNIVQMYKDEAELRDKEIAAAKKNQEVLAKHGKEQVKTFEDSIMILVRKGKAGFKDLFASMAEEAIRGMIRMAAQKTLLNSSGGFVGWGQGAQNMWSGLSSFFGGGGGGGAMQNIPVMEGEFGGHAGGLDYVPYDGYAAMLHKGERVQRSIEANSDRARGSGVVQNNDQRVIVQGDVGAKAMRAIRAGQSMQAARMAYADRY